MSENVESVSQNTELNRMIIDVDLNNDIVEFLLSLPNVGDINTRQSLLLGAGLDLQLINVISMDGPSRQFIQMLIANLQNYGELRDSRNAIEALLESAKKLVGSNKNKYCQSLIQRLANSSDRSDGADEQTFLPISFVNREREIDLFLSPNARPFHILDAPAGYGKTFLLNRIAQRFKNEKNWLCVYVEIKERSTLPEIFKLIITKLKPNPNNGSSLGQNSSNLKIELINTIKEYNFGPNANNPKGFAMFFDLQQIPDPDILKELYERLIPLIAEELSRWSSYLFEHHLRFIIAGRYISTAIASSKLSSTVNFERNILTPFDYKNVQTTVKNSLCKLPQSTIDQISAHLLFLTGGHPGCIAEILGAYKDKFPVHDDTLKLMIPDIWDMSIRYTVKHIQKAIDPDQQVLFNKLCIFRYTDERILSTLYQVPEERLFQVVDDLVRTYLVRWEKHLLRDNIIRRLLSIRLRQEEEKIFHLQCTKAQELCLKRLTDGDARDPEVWVIEFLFQVLQEHTFSVHDRLKRAEIRNQFFNEKLPNVCGLLLSKSHYSTSEKIRVLKDYIDNDWEFQFTVNYYLRERDYNEKPCQELKEYIENL